MEKRNIILENENTTFWIYEDGKLFNEKTNNFYQGSINGGYLKYSINWKKKRYELFAHRLVAEYFIQNFNNLPVVNHKDGNKLNNNKDNLEWVSYSDNNYHAYKTNLKEKTNGVTERQKYTVDLENEIWKQYENTDYYISNMGRARNIKTNNLLKGKITQKGYVEWCFSINGQKRSFLAHRLVFELFSGELINGLIINHIDGNKTNNNINNLEQISQSENALHSYYKINANKKIKKVGQYSLNDELIEVFDSCADAARKTQSHANQISRVCNGKMNTHHGYKWKYLNE